MTTIYAPSNSESAASQVSARARTAAPGGKDAASLSGDQLEHGVFAGLLGSLSVPALPQVAKASPERMFDSAEDSHRSARGDRIGVMTGEQRTDDLSASDPRQSVDARAKAADGPRIDSASHAGADTKVDAPPREAQSAFAEKGSVTERSSVPARSGTSAARAASERFANPSPQPPAGRETTGNGRVLEAPSRIGPAAQSVGVAAPTMDARGAESKGSAAQQIGRALASVGSSGAESARSVHQVAGDDRSSTLRDARAKPAAKAADGEQAEKPKDARPAELPEKFRSLVKAIRFGSGAGESSSARFRLDPPELGQLLVDVRMDEGKLRVRLKTESQEALSRISQRMAELRSALELHGLRIDQVEMEVDPRLADRGEDPLEFLGRQHEQPAAFAGSPERQPGTQEVSRERGGAASPLGELRHEASVGEDQYTELGAERGLDVRA